MPPQKTVNCFCNQVFSLKIYLAFKYLVLSELEKYCYYHRQLSVNKHLRSSLQFKDIGHLRVYVFIDYLLYVVYSTTKTQL